MVRVRFAPSPTGYLHIGGLRTALYNELFARHENGRFILRIEDTDRSRYVEGAVESLLRTLKWAGLEPDEGPYLADDGTIKERGANGPYVQSARLETYAAQAARLIADGKAYRCFCSPEALEETRQTQTTAGSPLMYDRRCRKLPAAEAGRRAARGEKHVIRLKVPELGQTAFDDVIRGRVVFENSLIDDQVLIKSDGFPTYHLANVVDDHLMGITHVIRGEDWLPSMPKHRLLYEAFGWTPPTFAHLPLLFNPDRSKLSKRQGDVAVEDYRKRGYLPEAVINFVALLGWNPSAEQEVYSKDELIAKFNLSRINKAGAVLNREKLDWLNREYLKKLVPEELERLVLPYFVDAGMLRPAGERVTAADGSDATEIFVRGLSLERSRVDRLDQLPEVMAWYFSDVAIDPKLIPWKKSSLEDAAERLKAVLEALGSADEAAFGEAKALEQPVFQLIADKGWGNSDTLWPMRYALTGQTASPSPFEVAWALGRDKSLARLKAALAAIS